MSVAMVRASDGTRGQRQGRGGRMEEAREGLVGGRKAAS